MYTISASDLEMLMYENVRTLKYGSEVAGYDINIPGRSVSYLGVGTFAALSVCFIGHLILPGIRW